MYDARAAHDHARERALRGSDSFVPFSDEAKALATVSRLFAAQVERTPDAPAIVTSSRTWSYAELDGRAERIAARIIDAIAGESGRVAIVVENGEAMIATVLGALKSGVPFVPIDPTGTPVARAAYIVEDAEIDLVLTTRRHVSFARDAAGDRNVMNVEDPWDGPPSTGPDSSAATAPEDVAWIIYTSGSTGEPKGVVQSHGNVVRFVTTEADAYGIGPDDRMVVAFSSSVNFWYRETLSALVKGATIYPVNLQEVGFGGLERVLLESHATLVTLVPSLFRQFAPKLSSPLPHLRLLKVGGEPTLRSDFELYRRTLGDGCVLLNRFGTTETAPVRYLFLDHASQVFETYVPIGYPVAGSDIMIVDADGNALPDGETGEIVVRSPYLALGYWHRPEITAATFRSAPDDPTERLYFTGDVGLKRADGCVVHLGRKDNQVQIRGYRVELAEIEMRLRDHHDVSDAAAAALPDEAGESRIVGYVVAGPTRPSIGALRSHLAESLPQYMVPGDWIFLQELPRAPNGKIYRKGLPLPAHLDPEAASTDFVSTSTPMERLVADHWRRALRGVDRIGIHDRFFDLGGESLGAMQVIAAIQADTGVEISPLDMGRQTLGQIARSCENRQTKPGSRAGLLRSLLRRLLPSRR